MLLELRRDFCTTITAATKLERLSSFTQSLITIGIALAVREHFTLSLEDSNALWIPSASSCVGSIAGAINPWARGARELVEPIFQLAADVGLDAVGKSMDVSLQLLLKTALVGTGDSADRESMRVYELLPVAFAVSFVSQRWENVDFDADLETFSGNEHAISLSMSKLILSILGLELGLVDTQTSLSRVRESAELFVEMASHFMAVMRVQESEQIYRFKPLRAMCSVLEATVNEFPDFVLSRSILEKHFPYSMIHSDNMDIALGKLKFGDKHDIALFE